MTHRRTVAYGLLYHGIVLEDYKPLALGNPVSPAQARVEMIEDAKKRRYGYVPTSQRHTVYTERTK